MKFTKVQHNILYCYEKDHSFWVKENNGKFEASMWRIRPEVSQTSVKEKTFDKQISAVNYLNSLSEKLNDNKE